ncbi:MAG: hypothetical protein ACREGJ_02575 [Candidatus Saccharimonadales bacterium]
MGEIDRKILETIDELSEVYVFAWEGYTLEEVRVNIVEQTKWLLSEEAISPTRALPGAVRLRVNVKAVALARSVVRHHNIRYLTLQVEKRLGYAA